MTTESPVRRLDLYRLAGSALLLLLLTLSLRLYRIGEPAPQIDEVHWRDRSRVVLHQFQIHNYRNATSAVGQPGVIPSLIMAFGQYLGDHYNAHYDFSANHPDRIDNFTAARIAVSAFSSLIIPCAFLLAAPVIGEIAAFVGALFLVFEPSLLGLGRLAHLDATLALFTTLTLLFYFYGVEYRKCWMKIYAGITWGCGLLVKPTIVAMIPAFLVYKLCRRAWIREEEDTGERELIAPSDLWTLFIGHLVFVALYTRTWAHTSDYLWRLKIYSPPADWLYRFGSVLHYHYFLALSFLLCSIAYLVIRAQRVHREGWRTSDFVSYFALVLTFFFVLALRPPLFENVARFWTWVFGLSHEVHHSVGFVSKPPKWGYVGMLFSRPTTVALLGGVLALFWIVSIWRRDSSKRERLILGLGSLIVLNLALWILMLSASQKQAFRYLVPAVMPLTLFAGWGWVEGCRRLSVFGERFKCKRLCSIGYTAILLIHAIAALRCYPDYILHYNSLSGGLAGAVARGTLLPLAGSNETVTVLHEIAQREGIKELRVAVLGDFEALQFAQERLYPVREARLKFVQFQQPVGESYVVVLAAYLKQLQDREMIDLNGSETIYEYKVDGYSVSSILKMPLGGYEKPLKIDLTKMHRNTGTVVDAKLIGEGANHRSDQSVILVNPKDHLKGFVFFGRSLLVSPGNYQIRLNLLRTTDHRMDLTQTTPIIKLKLGKECEELLELKDIKIEDTPTGATQFAIAHCSFIKGGSLQLSGYWFGKVEIGISSLEIKRASD